MMEEQQAPSARRARPSGREAKRVARAARAAASVPYITRSIPCYEVLTEEGLQIIERNADDRLAEVGIEVRQDPESLGDLEGSGRGSHR